MSNKKILFQEAVNDDLIEVWQQQQCRSLKINSIEQSSIDVDHPGHLTTHLYSAFLAALLFIDMPEKVLLAGLGGGALARYIYHINPDIKGDAIEINETVAKLATRYFQFPELNWRIHIDDIRNWRGSSYDLIVMDIADMEITPSWLISETFMANIKKQLSAHGVLVINLLPSDANAFSESVKLIRKVYHRKTLCMAVPGHNSILVFAFRQKPVYSALAAIRHRVMKLSETWEIDFDVSLDQLIKDNPPGSGIF